MNLTTIIWASNSIWQASYWCQWTSDQNVINSAISKWGTIFLLAWDYYVSSAIDINIPIRIVWETWTNIITTWNNIWLSVASNNVVLENINIDWLSQTNWDNTCRCIDIVSVDNVHIINCKAYNWWYYWFNIYQCNYCVFDRCHWFNNFRHWYHWWWDANWRNIWNVCCNSFAYWNWVDWFNDRWYWWTPEIWVFEQPNKYISLHSYNNTGTWIVLYKCYRWNIANCYSNNNLKWIIMLECINCNLSNSHSIWNSIDWVMIKDCVWCIINWCQSISNSVWVNTNLSNDSIVTSCISTWNTTNYAITWLWNVIQNNI